VTSPFLCWNWNASLLNSTWGYNVISTEGIPVNRLFVPICHVPYLWKRDARNLKDYHIRQSSNVKLFGAQRIRETAKPLQFLELMKASWSVAEIQGRDQRVWGVTKGIHWTLERTISWNWWGSLHVLSREMQDWTVRELWSTSRRGDKKGQIFEHSLKSF